MKVEIEPKMMRSRMPRGKPRRANTEGIKKTPTPSERAHNMNTAEVVLNLVLVDGL